MNDDYAGLFLRIGLAFLFFYFSWDKFSALQSNVVTFQSLLLVGLMPFSAKTAVIISGVVEAVIGLLLLSGSFHRFTALSAAFWNFLIVINLGFQAATYDIALVFAGLAYYFTGPGKFYVKVKDWF